MYEFNLGVKGGEVFVEEEGTGLLDIALGADDFALVVEGADALVQGFFGFLGFGEGGEALGCHGGGVEDTDDGFGEETDDAFEGAFEDAEDALLLETSDGLGDQAGETALEAFVEG